jgi:hypothetical protein
MMQHSMDQEPGIRQNPWVTNRLGSGNLDRRVNRPDVLCDGEESPRNRGARHHGGFMAM